jgi:hypothetical protein
MSNEYGGCGHHGVVVRALYHEPDGTQHSKEEFEIMKQQLLTLDEATITLQIQPKGEDKPCYSITFKKDRQPPMEHLMNIADMGIFDGEKQMTKFMKAFYNLGVKVKGPAQFGPEICEDCMAALTSGSTSSSKSA